MKLRVVALVAAVAPILLARLAFAQMSDNEKKAAARAAYTEGVELQEKGKYAEALADFEKAEKLFDAPTHLLHMAECQAQLGKLVEATETYETLSRKQLEKGSPDVFVKAQEQAAKELETLRPRIPTLRVNVKPEPSTLPGLEIKLNDKTMPVEAIGIARPINPGTYKITASAQGSGTKAPTDVEIKEKDTKSVDITLEKGATGGVAGATPTKPVEDETGPTPFGILIGVRPLAFIPFGKADANTPMKQYAGPGVGVGIDGIARLSKRFLVGASIEGAIMNGPDRYVPSNTDLIPAGTEIRANVSARTIYAGVLAGFMPDVDKFTPVGFIHIGYRLIQRDITLNVNRKTLDDEVEALPSGGVHLGVSFPAGPLRILPLLNFQGGRLAPRSCASAESIGSVGASAALCEPPEAGLFFMAGISVGAYYHVDFGRQKPQ